MEVSKTLTGRSLLVGISSLAVLGIGWRLMPHLPNFAPISAIALMAGTALTRRQTLLLLLGILLVTDATLGFYTGFLWTWAGLGLGVFIGHSVRGASFVAKVGFGAVGTSLLFFLVSNFGVWVASGMYPPTIAGLVTCYAMALPFFGVTLASTVVFSMVLFKSYEYLKNSRHDLYLQQRINLAHRHDSSFYL